jgi:hypothetical protein
MGVLNNARTVLFDSLRKRESTLMRFLLQLPEDSLKKRKLTMLRVFLQLLEVLRLHGKDTQLYNLMEALCGLLFAIQT